jgi:hypothetical protein
MGGPGSGRRKTRFGLTTKVHWIAHEFPGREVGVVACGVYPYPMRSTVEPKGVTCERCQDRVQAVIGSGRSVRKEAKLMPAT